MNDDEMDDLLRDAARSYRLPPEPPREAIWARIEAARAATPVLALHPAPVVRWRTAASIAAVLVIGIAIGRASQTVGAPPAAAVSGARVASMPARGDGTALASPESPTVAAPDAATAGDAGARSGASEAPARVAGAAPAREFPEPSPPLRLASSTRPATLPRHLRGGIGEGTGMNAYRLAVVEHLARTEVLLVGFRSGTTARQATRADAEQFGALSRELLQTTRLLLATRATDDPALTRLLEDLELVLMQIAQYAAEGGARRGDLDAINQSLDHNNVLPKLRSTIPAGAPVPAGS